YRRSGNHENLIVFSRLYSMRPLDVNATKDGDKVGFYRPVCRYDQRSASTKKCHVNMSPSVDIRLREIYFSAAEQGCDITTPGILGEHPFLDAAENCGHIDHIFAHSTRILPGRFC